MAYRPRDFSYLQEIGEISEQQLRYHVRVYHEHVRELNRVIQDLADLRRNAGPEPGDLHRRFSWELNGMRLHEFFFENLGGRAPLSPRLALRARLEQDFGGLSRWEADFARAALARGTDWVIAYWDLQGRALFNVGHPAHDRGILVGCAPILVLDVSEHAYAIDFGREKARYVETFFRNIQWHEVSRRFEAAVDMNR